MARFGSVMSVGNKTLTWGEQSPLVMGIAAGVAEAARLVGDGADALDLGGANGVVVREVRHNHPAIPIAVDLGDGAADDADLLVAPPGSSERELARIAASSGAAVVCSIEDAGRLHAAGVAQLLVTPGRRPDIGTVRGGAELAGGDWPVLLTVSCGGVPEIGAEVIAAAAHAAAAGVRIIRTDRVTETRRTVDMIASIRGTRPPAKVRRALA